MKSPDDDPKAAEEGVPTKLKCCAVNVLLMSDCGKWSK